MSPVSSLIITAFILVPFFIIAWERQAKDRDPFSIHWFVGAGSSMTTVLLVTQHEATDVLLRSNVTLFVGVCSAYLLSCVAGQIVGQRIRNKRNHCAT